MLIYAGLWAWAFPELRRLSTAERRATIRAALGPIARMSGEEPATERSPASTAAAALAYALFIPLLFARSLSIFLLVWIVAAAGVWLLMPLGIIIQARQKGDPVRRHLRRQMNELGQPICIECGYDLRAAAGLRCSECGSPLPLMRFRMQTQHADGQPAGDWNVTAVSEAHARSLLAAQLEAAGQPAACIVSVQQVVEETIGACGEITPI